MSRQKKASWSLSLCNRRRFNLPLSTPTRNASDGIEAAGKATCTSSAHLFAICRYQPPVNARLCECVLDGGVCSRQRHRVCDDDDEDEHFGSSAVMDPGGGLAPSLETKQKRTLCVHARRTLVCLLCFCFFQTVDEILPHSKQKKYLTEAR